MRFTRSLFTIGNLCPLPFFFVSLARGLSILSFISKNQLCVSLIFFIVLFLISFLFFFTFHFFIFYFFSTFLRWNFRLLFETFSHLQCICIECYKLPSPCCCSCVPQTLICVPSFIFRYLYFELHLKTFSLARGLFRSVSFGSKSSEVCLLSFNYQFLV